MNNETFTINNAYIEREQEEEDSHSIIPVKGQIKSIGNSPKNILMRKRSIKELEKDAEFTIKAIQTKLLGPKI